MSAPASLAAVGAWRGTLLSAMKKNASLPNAKYVQLATVRPNGRPANRTVVFRCAAAVSSVSPLATRVLTRRVAQRLSGRHRQLHVRDGRAQPEGAPRRAVSVSGAAALRSRRSPPAPRCARCPRWHTAPSRRRAGTCRRRASSSALLVRRPTPACSAPPSPKLANSAAVPARRPAADYRPAGRGPRHAGGACASCVPRLHASTRCDARTRWRRRRAPRRGSACRRRAARSSRGPSPGCRGSRATQRWTSTTRRSSRTGCASQATACACLWASRVLTRRAQSPPLPAFCLVVLTVDEARRATRLRACARRVR